MLRDGVQRYPGANFIARETPMNFTAYDAKAVNAFREKRPPRFTGELSSAMNDASGSGRPLYRHAELSRVLNPASIAIAGASPRAGSFGERLQTNLAGCYEGDVYLVNAKYDEIAGLRCYPSLAALPVRPDCVAITVSREAAESIVTEAAM